MSPEIDEEICFDTRQYTSPKSYCALCVDLACFSPLSSSLCANPLSPSFSFRHINISAIRVSTLSKLQQVEQAATVTPWLMCPDSHHLSAFPVHPPPPARTAVPHGTTNSNQEIYPNSSNAAQTQQALRQPHFITNILRLPSTHAFSLLRKPQRTRAQQVHRPRQIRSATPRFLPLLSYTPVILWTKQK